MQKRILTITPLCLLATIILGSFSKDSSHSKETKANDFYVQTDLNACITTASNKWGGPCMTYGYNENKFTVFLVNTCSEKLDLMCAVQSENNRWQVFYKLDMAPQDTLEAFACNGNGRYLKWVRKAGDESMLFPSKEEVNEQY